ncbi:L,D-transpeptidase [Nitrobacter sp.]|uniref:L,D-transpeptidase n=1 Tax=Nitrobacter sp. TaxID=29420 RepID=UPI0029CAAD07|nr:L,D-transpeptidase family protein [Nitrobacter sp.]
MRMFLIPVAGLLLLGAVSVAQAKVSILVDKDNQKMTVSVDGVERYHWPVSSGNPSHETPNGRFQTFRMEADHFSKEFDDAPMPHSIFFTKAGHAIHGTFSEGSLGSPVSHGCVRISRANASTLYALVRKEGVLNTTVTLTGSSRVALARNPRGKRKTDVARHNPPADDQSYDNAGNPVELTPGQIAPTQQPQAAIRGDDGYIYPADGSSSDQRYPAPRSSRRLRDAQNVPRRQQYYYSDQADYGYAQPYPPQVYAPQPYRPRGLFTDFGD